MEIHLKAPRIWLANEAVDFRKAINGLSELVVTQFKQVLGDNIYIFYNRARNKIKILAYHRNGTMLIYKRLDKKRFTFKSHQPDLYEMTQQQLSYHG